MIFDRILASPIFERFGLRKKIYSLKDIEKILTFIPPFFIFVLGLGVFIVGFFILEYRQKNEITLITQKIELEKKFTLQNELKKQTQLIDNQIHHELTAIEQKLKKEVHTLLGIAKGIMGHKSLHVKDLLPYIAQTQLQNGINFAIFDENYTILHGKKELQNIQELIFSQIHNEALLKITLMYIASQGDESSLNWKNDKTNTIQTSYFEKLFPQNCYIGAFSSIDSLHKITRKTILQNIDKQKSQDFYIWFYDDASKQIYNFANEQEWQKAPVPFAKILHSYDKYYFSIGISSMKDSGLQKSVKAILDDYKEKKTLLFLIVLFSVSVLIFSTSVFAAFIKRIFSFYNKRLENKNRLLNILKERFELAVIASNDGLWDTNFETGKTFFSKKWLDILGYSSGDIKSYKEWFELIHKEDRELLTRALNDNINEDKDHIICEYRLKTKSNRYKWVLGRGKVFLNAQKKPKRLLMMSMDIDDAKRLQKDLKDTELLVSDGDIVVFRIQNSDKLNVLFVSKSIKVYGYSPEDFLTKNLCYLDIIHPEDKDEFIASLNAFIKQGFNDFSKSYRIITKSSEVRWVFARMLFLKDDFGTITNLYGYIYDITALKRSELELAQKVRQEVEKNQEKQKLLIQQNKLAAMGEMIGSIAHQWRQPLNNISLILHFIKDNYKNMQENEITKYANNAKEQLEYMSQTIDDFRNFYKPSKKRDFFDVNEAIIASISILKSQIQKANISLHVSTQSFMIDGFENEFKQAILNILSNAIDAINQQEMQNAFIRIEIEQNHICIANNGGCASKEVLERMFEPYFTTKFEKKGTGIGLYMSKTIIENMQGIISVCNTQEGVAFTIEFAQTKNKI